LKAYKKEEMSMIMNYYHPFQHIPEVDYRQQGQQFFPGFPGGNTNQRLDRLERQVDRLSGQLDRLERRVDRIERRLGIGREDF
jgi:hypothetical protein